MQVLNIRLTPKFTYWQYTSFQSIGSYNVQTRQNTNNTLSVGNATLLALSRDIEILSKLCLDLDSIAQQANILMPEITKDTLTPFMLTVCKGVKDSVNNFGIQFESFKEYTKKKYSLSIPLGTITIELINQ